MPANPSSVPIPLLWLEIRNLGPVVSFKNSKVLIAKGAGGKPLPRPLLVTKGEYKKQMEKIVQSFVSQLFLKSQTKDDVTGTALFPPSSIALLMPADDSLNDIPEIHLHTEHVPVGEEGADIIIEKLL
jgi:hypothetical protein